MPLYGNELDPTVNPYRGGPGPGRPARPAEADFVGREALRRIAESAPARRLVGLAMTGRGIARHGYPIYAGDRPQRDRHQRDALAVARAGDRDGLRRAGRCGTGYDPRGRDPRRAGRRRGRSATVLPPSALSGRPGPASTGSRLGARRFARDGSPGPALHGRSRVGAPGRRQRDCRASPSLPLISSATSSSSSCLRPAGHWWPWRPSGWSSRSRPSATCSRPCSGDVVETNPALAGQPELVNSDPYGAGWMLRLTVADTTELDRLLDPAAYDQLIAEA